MLHRYIVEAETEADLVVHFHALDRYCADSDFEGTLRGLWKHGDMGEEAFKYVEQIWEAWHESRADIGEVR